MARQAVQSRRRNTTVPHAIATVTRGQAAFSRGDAEAVMDLATSDVEWGASGAFPGIAEVYRGRHAIKEWMRAIRSAWEVLEATLDEVLHHKEDVIVISERLRGRGRGSGVEVEMSIFLVYWFENRKISRREAFTEPCAALEAAGLPRLGGC